MSIDLSKFRKHQKARGRAVPTEPKVLLGRSGQIMINEPAWKLFGADDPSALTVLFNDEEHIVGLQSSTPDDPDAFRVHVAGRRHQLNARRFLQENKIDVEDVRLSPPNYDKKTKLLYFKIESVEPAEA